MGFERAQVEQALKVSGHGLSMCADGDRARCASGLSAACRTGACAARRTPGETRMARSNGCWVETRPQRLAGTAWEQSAAGQGFPGFSAQLLERTDSHMLERVAEHCCATNAGALMLSLCAPSTCKHCAPPRESRALPKHRPGGWVWHSRGGGHRTQLTAVVITQWLAWSASCKRFTWRWALAGAVHDVACWLRCAASGSAASSTLARSRLVVLAELQHATGHAWSTAAQPARRSPPPRLPTQPESPHAPHEMRWC